jgi:hypothetical protein
MVDNLYNETKSHEVIKENRDEINLTVQQDMLYWPTEVMEDMDTDPIKNKFLNINKAT